MKKIIFIFILGLAVFGIWKYLAFKSQPASSADGQPSIIKDAKDTIEKTANYIPDTIDRKKQAEIKINAATAQENDRLKKAMEELQ